MTILATARANHLPFSLLAFSFLREYQKDPEFSLHDGFLVQDWLSLQDRRAPCGGVTWMRLAERIDEPPYHFLQTMTS